MEKYKVDITLLNIPDAYYDELMFEICDFLDEKKVEYEIGIGEEIE